MGILFSIFAIGSIGFSFLHAWIYFRFFLFENYDDKISNYFFSIIIDDDFQSLEKYDKNILYNKFRKVFRIIGFGLILFFILSSMFYAIYSLGSAK
jgi:hypothetical protein